jgi:hypothetical protein
MRHGTAPALKDALCGAGRGAAFTGHSRFSLGKLWQRRAAPPAGRGRSFHCRVQAKIPWAGFYAAGSTAGRGPRVSAMPLPLPCRATRMPRNVTQTIQDLRGARAALTDLLTATEGRGRPRERLIRRSAAPPRPRTFSRTYAASLSSAVKDAGVRRRSCRWSVWAAAHQMRFECSFVFSSPQKPERAKSYFCAQFLGHAVGQIYKSKFNDANLYIAQ